MASLVGSFSLPSSLLQQLEQEAKRQNRPISWLVRDALILYLSSLTIPTTSEDSTGEVSRNGAA